ncbi:MAG TPA: hypothetical protein DDZ89_12930 [Clostridiales bacterium]|nr:hypothetical protein [Clostridiales bacterium]
MENNEMMQSGSTDNTLYNEMTDIHVSINTKELKSMASWAKFRGIMDIIVGVLSSLGIITAIYGIPQIIAGIKLLESASALQQTIQTNNQAKMTEFFSNHRQFFMISGISTIVKIAFSFLIIVVWIAFFFIFFREIINQPELREFFNQENFSTF